MFSMHTSTLYIVHCMILISIKSLCCKVLTIHTLWSSKGLMILRKLKYFNNLNEIDFWRCDVQTKPTKPNGFKQTKGESLKMKFQWPFDYQFQCWMQQVESISFLYITNRFLAIFILIFVTSTTNCIIYLNLCIYRPTI